MRILSGIQPTGYLHLGNYVGALKNWVKLQDEYDCYYMIADIHSLTSNQTNYKNDTNNYITHMVADWIAAGLDPEKSIFFLQSDVPEHVELFSLFMMITPVAWLERNPTYKEKMDVIKGKDLDNIGFLAYPVLQAADIALYEADRVPVGKDQLPHLEISREIVRRFNHLYGDEILKEPQPILAQIPKLNGLDGRKMSKSYNNAIFLKDSAEEVRQKTMKMVTDVSRKLRKDPGHPDECNLFPYYLAFTDNETFLNTIRSDCTSADMGCVDCKKKLIELLNDSLSDFRIRRNALLERPDDIADILNKGAQRAGETAKTTMEKVRSAVGMQSSRRYREFL